MGNPCPLQPSPSYRQTPCCLSRWNQRTPCCFDHSFHRLEPSSHIRLPCGDSLPVAHDPPYSAQGRLLGPMATFAPSSCVIGSDDPEAAAIADAPDGGRARSNPALSQALPKRLRYTAPALPISSSTSPIVAGEADKVLLHLSTIGRWQQVGRASAHGARLVFLDAIAPDGHVQHLRCSRHGPHQGNDRGGGEYPCLSTHDIGLSLLTKPYCEDFTEHFLYLDSAGLPLPFQWLGASRTDAGGLETPPSSGITGRKEG